MSLPTHRCGCGECYQYGAGAGHCYDHCQDFETRMPFYQSLAQPLVYYTQMQPQARNKNWKAPRKTNQNCFMKAFRWYTQERMLQADYASRPSEMSGFASWLDEKYNDFLQDKKSDDYWPVFPKQTDEFQAKNFNAIELGKQEQRNIAKSKSSRKKDRFRSTSKTSKEHGCAPENHHSLEYILKPLELSCPASENCNQCDIHRPLLTQISSQPNYPTIWDVASLNYFGDSETLKYWYLELNRSKSSYQSLATLISKKSIYRSRSFDENLNNCHNGEYRNVVCDCGQHETYSKSKAKSKECPKKYDSLPKEVDIDFGCKYLHDRHAAANQYHNYDSTAFNHQTPYASRFAEECNKQVNDDVNKKSLEKKLPSVRCKCLLTSKKDTHISKIKHDIICKCPEYGRQDFDQYCNHESKACCANCDAEKLRAIISYGDDKHYNSATCDGAVQSSDHSILLENIGLHKHPLLLKIVLGDKLNEDSIPRDFK